MLRSLLASLCAAIALADAPASDAADRPNVLFILTEDQGQQLSYLGTPGLETPNMDRIANAGVYYSQAFVSYPVCSASKASLFTGHYGHTTGLVDNTHDFFVPADQLTPSQRNNPIYQRVRIADQFPTLVEILDEQGYHLAVSGKLHVAPNEKFPYDQWFRVPSHQRVTDMIAQSKRLNKPFFFLCNIQAPHRPFRNSDQVAIGVDPNDVQPPAFLPDTPTVRKDWAEYLDYCEVADHRIGTVLQALDDAGVTDNTLIILMGDHGPAYHRGKMSLYQFGLNVPLVFAGPGVPKGKRTDAMFSGVDMMPTLLEMLEIEPPETAGISLADVVQGNDGAQGRSLVFAEIAHQGQQRDDGMQERSVFDGRWKLIFRNQTDSPRTVNTDLRYWVLSLPDGRKIPWHNRVYDEIVTRKDEFPHAFRMLAEIDNGAFKITLPRYELYDTLNDPNEFTNLADDRRHQAELQRLMRELKAWTDRTDDRFLSADEIR